MLLINLGHLQYKSSLLSFENEKFKEHLKDRSDRIKSSLTSSFEKFPIAPPDVKDLQEKVSNLLASEKSHIVELQRLNQEKEQLSERLDNASYRYVLAEKKLDRAKSAAVARIEKQAVQGSIAPTEDASAGKDSRPMANGNSDGNINEDAESAKREAVATVAKRSAQLIEMEEANKKLTDEVTSLQTRLVSLSDEDYAKCNLFKLLKTQHEDVIKRINSLEATNIQLREESQRLQAERSAYRAQMDEESRALIGEIESQLARAETDLARIRNSRDELVADVAMKKASLDQQNLSLEQIRELAAARESRIAALEAEVERLRAQKAETDTSGDDLTASLTDEKLREKVATLEKECALLNNELPSMEAAWKKAQTLAAKKVDEVARWEEQIAKLTAEKAKADQKYFGAMKAKEAREAEIRTLRAQNLKTSDIVSQLKAAESTSRALVVNLEKQLSEMRETMAEMSSQQRTLQQRVTELTITSEGLATQNSDLRKHLNAKDGLCADAERAKRQVEVEAESLKVRLDETLKSLESWKKKGLEGNADEYEALRVSELFNPENISMDVTLIFVIDVQKIAICTVCNKNFKNTAIKSCGHIFCNECVEERITSRSRKCPNCGKSFGANDHMRVTL